MQAHHSDDALFCLRARNSGKLEMPERAARRYHCAGLLHWKHKVLGIHFKVCLITQYQPLPSFAWKLEHVMMLAGAPIIKRFSARRIPDAWNVLRQLSLERGQACDYIAFIARPQITRLLVYPVERHVLMQRVITS